MPSVFEVARALQSMARSSQPLDVLHMTVEAPAIDPFAAWHNDMDVVGVQRGTDYFVTGDFVAPRERVTVTAKVLPNGKLRVDVKNYSAAQVPAGAQIVVSIRRVE